MLPSWVSSCEIDGQIVYLDVLANRYSRLDMASGSLVARDEVDKLRPELKEIIARRGWLGDVMTARSSACLVQKPEREHFAECDQGDLAARHLTAAFGALARARLAIARRSFDALLWRVQENNAFARQIARPVARRSDLVMAFEYAERMVIRKNRCLLRSIALQHLLARRGCESTLVFGVRLHPFQAHCWLQEEELVLNDTMEHVGAFKIIRAIK